MTTQRCQHVHAMKQLLREEGATDIAAVREGRRIRVSWKVGERSFFVMVPGIPRDGVHARIAGRQAVHRICPELRP